MTTLNSIKDDLIGHIMASKNEKLLKAINSIFSSTHEVEKEPLSAEQIEMLLMSEQDIAQGRLISAEELDESDLEWLK